MGAASDSSSARVPVYIGQCYGRETACLPNHLQHVHRDQPFLHVHGHDRDLGQTSVGALRR